MTPIADEPEAAKGLVTRAQLVDKIRVLAQDVLGGVKYGFDNVVAQLKIANSGVELSTEGIGMLRKVKDGKIVIPAEYQHMVDEEEEEEEDDENMDNGH
ncbi:hypothetical protein A2U01_0073174, partial [Trifolium medium]|nr:hypothetical protein [Trifolium medium]